MFIMSVKDVVRRTPDAEREFFRFFRGSERLALQGFPVKVVRHLPADLLVKAAGNAYPTALIIAVLHPALQALGEGSLAAWPPVDLCMRSVPSSVGKVLAAFKRNAKHPRKFKVGDMPVEIMRPQKVPRRL